MATLKVLPLDFWMNPNSFFWDEDEYEKVPESFNLIGRDGFYCRDGQAWFEVGGIGYLFTISNSVEKGVSHFKYSLRINDELILPEREVKAMTEILKISRDAAVKKAISKRLRDHNYAYSSRALYRNGRKTRIKLIGK